MWSKSAADGKILVLLCDVSELSEERLLEFEECIHPSRIAKAYRHIFDANRRLSLASSAMLLAGLQKLWDPELTGDEIESGLRFGPWGKPEIADCPFRFNITHSGRICGCAFSFHEVGLDVEKLRFRTASSALPVSADEALLRAKAWSRMECLVKLSGYGLSGRCRNTLSDFAENAADTMGTDSNLCIREIPLPEGYAGFVSSNFPMDLMIRWFR